MSLRSASRGHVVVATALFFALGSRAAAAQTTGGGAGGSASAGATAAAAAPAAAQAGAPNAPTGPLSVWLDAAGSSFDKARLQASLSHELGREVVFSDDAAAAAVQIRLDGTARAEVRYKTPSGEELSRSVDLPPDRERSVQVVSWLTVNLVRDEASELLDELRARRKEEADARAAADKAAADKAAADKAAADKAAAELVARNAEQAKKNQQAAAPPPAPNDVLLRDPLRSFDVALATPLSLLRDSPRRELKLQLALGYGESGAVRGVAFAPGVLRIRNDLLGVSVAAGAVLIGGSVRGIVGAAGYSQVGGNLQGIQLGAGVALQRGPVARGAVLAAGGAFAQNLDGLVLAGGIASAKSLHGAAVAAGATVVRGPSQGILLAGGVNFSADHRGIEIAAGVNTARDLDGIALAPINVHRRVKGLQFGIVNVAEEVDGASIGILSIVKNGRVQPVLWTAVDRSGSSVHVSIKSIAGYAFTELGGGIALGIDSFTYDAGIGAHLRLSQSWFLEPGVHYSGTQNTNDTTGSPNEHQLHYLAELGLRVGDKLDLLAGAGVRHTIVGGSGSAVGPELRVGIGFF
jgi:hypothetical protein